MHSMQWWNTTGHDLRISDLLGSKITPIAKRISYERKYPERNTYENKTLLPIHKCDEHEVYKR